MNNKLQEQNYKNNVEIIYKKLKYRYKIDKLNIIKQ